MRTADVMGHCVDLDSIQNPQLKSVLRQREGGFLFRHKDEHVDYVHRVRPPKKKYNDVYNDYTDHTDHAEYIDGYRDSPI